MLREVYRATPRESVVRSREPANQNRGRAKDAERTKLLGVNRAISNP
jgi:hypothetical protein